MRKLCHYSISFDTVFIHDDYMYINLILFQIKTKYKDIVQIKINSNL